MKGSKLVRFISVLVIVVLSALVLPSVKPHQTFDMPPSETSPMISQSQSIIVGSQPKGVLYDPTNEKIYVADYGSSSVSVIDPTTETVTATINTGYTAWNLAYDPMNNRIYVANDYTNVLTIIDPTTNTVAGTINTGSWVASVGVTFDQINGYLYAIGGTAPPSSSYIVVVNPNTNSVVTTIPVDFGPACEGTAVAPSTNYLYWPIWDANSATVIDVLNAASNTLVTTVTVGSATQATLYDPSNGLIYASARPGVTIINSTTNQVIGQIPVSGGPTYLACDPTAHLVAVSAWGSNRVSFIDDVSNTVLQTLSVGSGPQGLAFDPKNGNLYVAASSSNEVDVVRIPLATSWDPSRDSYNFMNAGGVGASDGWCYGMSSTAILYFEHYFQSPLTNPSAPFFPCQSPEAQNTSALWPSAIDKLNNVTLAIMVHHVYDIQNTPLLPHFSFPVPEGVQFLELRYYLLEGEPVVLTMWTFSAGFKFHSVVAWAIQELSDGAFQISLYDPMWKSTIKYANYNPFTESFVYDRGDKDESGNEYVFTGFVVITPGSIQSSWFLNPIQQGLLWWQSWFRDSVPGYYLIFSDKSVDVTVNGLKDYFRAQGDSSTFVCGISGSCGIEEGNMQVYAIPTDKGYPSVDPDSNESMLFITRVDNESGQLVGHGYLLNATTTQGLLNYTATPSNSSLSVSTGDSGLNASVTFFSATQQGYSVSDVLTAQIDAGQSVNLTAPCVASFTASKNVVCQGYPVPINVTITNTGDNPENITLTVYANTTIIDSETVLNLLNGTLVNLICVGNTSSCVYGNYTISVRCEPNGINEAANNFMGGWVVVSRVGDLTGGSSNAWDFVPDGVVDGSDLSIVARCFGSWPGAQPPIIWNANCDVNNDGVVDGSDLAIVAKAFGTGGP